MSNGFRDRHLPSLAWIIAAIAAIVAIVAAALGAGQAFFAVEGTFDETDPSVDCCEPDVETVAGETELTVAGVASLVATVAAAVGLSDAEDPWWRGQNATHPGSGEITQVERVDVVFAYPGGAPNAGVAYPVDVKWRYERVTDKASYTYTVDEQQTNVHVSDGVEVHAPATHNAFEGPLVFRARFLKQGAGWYKGEELYAFSLLRSPDGKYFPVDLMDDGIDHDDDANDGYYTGAIHFKEIYGYLRRRNLRLEGIWKIYVFAQDTNGATAEMPPEVAATHIGGYMIASAVHLTFDSSLPCPLTAQASVNVFT